MTAIYKLLKPGQKSFHDDSHWIVGEWREATGSGVDLCSDGFFHAYSHPLLAVLLAPIHLEQAVMELWEGEGDGVSLDDNGLKQGYKRMRILNKIPLPEISIDQVVAFASLCSDEMIINGHHEITIIDYDYLLEIEQHKKHKRWAATLAARAAQLSIGIDLISLAEKAIKGY